MDGAGFDRVVNRVHDEMRQMGGNGLNERDGVVAKILQGVFVDGEDSCQLCAQSALMMSHCRLWDRRDNPCACSLGSLEFG